MTVPAAPLVRGAHVRSRRTARQGPASPLERLRRPIFWPFVTPALLIMVLFYLAPIVFVVWLSLHRWAGYGPMEYVGFANYVTISKDPTFVTSIVNTLKILFIVGIVTFALAFALTMALRRMRGRFFARSVLFFPNLINSLVFAVFAGMLFNPQGLVNNVLAALGVDTPPKWLAADNQFTLIMVILAWGATGYFTSIIMSAVDQIPDYYYEAAQLDGAGPLRQFFTVTLPLSWDVVTVCAVLWTMSSVKVFELILVFGGSRASTPNAGNWTTSLYVYLSAFQSNGGRAFGVAAAAALVSLLMVVVLTFGLRRAMRRESLEF
ncbi:carbohydrate ABC transporter permease [Microbacterium nymphoidis]|uniref:carbohydrate ABC transporter permease n=1 Tax=Microbacterium nymphoidis TaxID=2898586 RepID=UPI001E37D63D|nr:sugar ABC transporter permease [Microbacterium nymphoidis]MCD2498470.1 sugar ABC transporter permease [Microbacterium nymphoidis]